MPFTFDPSAYGPAVAALLAADRHPELGPGTPIAAQQPQLEAAAKTLSPTRAAGLWVLFDFLDAAHEICQADESDADRNFWHAVLHRREPDAGNSKYWWRRVGPHPVLKQLAAEAPAVGYTYTTPHDFVDFCERVRETGTADETTAKRVQLLEWRLMFSHGPG